MSEKSAPSSPGETVDVSRPIGRGEFLSARMAYLASMRDEGESLEGMIEAVNINDLMQARLCLLTFDERHGVKP